MELPADKKLREQITLLEDRMAELKEKAHRQGRVMNQSEIELCGEILAEVQRMKGGLTGGVRTLSPSQFSNGLERRIESGAYELRGPNDAKDFHSLFGNRGYQWEDRDTGFFQAVFSGRHHPGLLLRGMTEGVPSDGGFLVPSQQAAQIHAVALESELVLPRAFVQPMQSNELKIPAMAIGSHASSLFGGFTASFVAEAGSISEADPKVRSMTLIPRKLVGMLRFSSELAADIPGGENQIIQICGRGLGWYRDKYFLSGSGAGQPLGILNAPCLVTVPKESGQAAATILYENLVKMMARMYAGSFKNSVWVCSQSCIPQLLSLTIPVGVGGSHIPVMSESGGQLSILSRPVVISEKVPALGAIGDIMLCDFSQYVVGLREEMRFDMSIHVHFDTDEMMARLITRFDGQPLWSEALTLADGTTTVSPFVALATRA